jgi:hypothetical protein
MDHATSKWFPVAVDHCDAPSSRRKQGVGWHEYYHHAGRIPLGDQLDRQRDGPGVQRDHLIGHPPDRLPFPRDDRRADRRSGGNREREGATEHPGRGREPPGHLRRPARQPPGGARVAFTGGRRLIGAALLRPPFTGTRGGHVGEKGSAHRSSILPGSPSDPARSSLSPGDLPATETRKAVTRDASRPPVVRSACPQVPGRHLETSDGRRGRSNIRRRA